jgi:NAD kinase
MPAPTLTCSPWPHLMHGDRIVVTRSKHHVRFLHPKGWTYFDTLRKNCIGMKE